MYKNLIPELQAYTHHEFKIAAANELVEIQNINIFQTRGVDINLTEIALHPLEKLPYSPPCYYFQHGHDKARKN